MRLGLGQRFSKALQTAKDLHYAMDPLVYTKDELEKQMILLENHLKQAPSMDKGFCSECIDKHLKCIEGLSEEGTLFAEGPSEREMFLGFARKARKMRDMSFSTLSGQQFLEMASTTRDMRKQMKLEDIKGLLKDLIDPRVRSAVDLVNRLSKDYDVPNPKIRFTDCEGVLKGACYSHEDPFNPQAPGVLFMPLEGLSPNVVAHEFFHYMRHVQGDMESGHDEAKATAFAHEVVSRLSQEYKTLNIESAHNYLSDGIDMVFEAFEWFHRPGAKLLRTDPKTLNEAWTPEIFGSVGEAVADILISRFGTAIAGLVTAGVLEGISTLPRIGPDDKKFIHELSGHAGTRWMRLLAPADMSLALVQARDFGRAVAAFDASGMKNALWRGVDVAKADFTRLTDTWKALVAAPTPPLVGVPPPPAPPAPPPAPAPPAPEMVQFR